jgi:hypothetical protein
MDVLVGTDFFTVEVVTWRGLVTYYVLFFIQLERRDPFGFRDVECENRQGVRWRARRDREIGKVT